jgi:hypothetical protein
MHSLGANSQDSRQRIGETAKGLSPKPRSGGKGIELQLHAGDETSDAAGVLAGLVDFGADV